MKKLLIFFVMAAMLATASACGEDSKDSELGSSAAESSTIDSELNELESELESIYFESEGGADALAGDLDAFINSQLSDEDRQTLISEAAKSGIDVSFDESGVMNYTYGDGYTGQIGGSWQNNEYTELVPEPKVGSLLSTVTQDGAYSVMYSGMTRDDVDAYIELLVEAGFEDGEPLDGEYDFYAVNDDGVAVYVNYIDSVLMLSIIK